jgi:hypothetical protein
MARAGWSMAALALVATGLSALIPVIGTIIIGPLAAIIIGAGAGWWASKLAGAGTAGRGAGAGSIAGLGAFLGAIIGTVVLFSIFGNNPEFQQQFQEGLNEAQQQNPDAQLPALNPAAIAGAGGAVFGFCVGLFNIFLSMIGGLIAGLVYGNRGTTAAAAPVGGYVPQNSTLPQMTSQTDYNTRPFPQQSSELGDAGGESNVRTYPSDSDDNKARIYPDNDQRQ